MTAHSSNPAKPAATNGVQDLQARLYREIGISAVAAALESATYQVEATTKPERKHALVGKAA